MMEACRVQTCIFARPPGSSFRLDSSVESGLAGHRRRWSQERGNRAVGATLSLSHLQERHRMIGWTAGDVFQKSSRNSKRMKPQSFGCFGSKKTSLAPCALHLHPSLLDCNMPPRQRRGSSNSIDHTQQWPAQRLRTRQRLLADRLPRRLR